jgi:GNAT superfamily N-acetyltransferase
MKIELQKSIENIDWKAVAAIFSRVGWGDGLRPTVGHRLPEEIAQAFARSSYVRFAFCKDELVGVGRTLDDGQYYALIVDLEIVPEFQGNGIGSRILAELKDETLESGATISGGNMLTQQQAQDFAQDWIQAWNSHDLDRILAHYDESVVLVSPIAAQLLNDPQGTVSGKLALQAYFKKGLDAYPNLTFELIDVMWGISSVVFYYVNQNGTKSGEFMELTPTGTVIKVIANYNL